MTWIGLRDGCRVGFLVGNGVGLAVGFGVGLGVGERDGVLVGMLVGNGVDTDVKAVSVGEGLGVDSSSLCPSQSSVGMEKP